MQTRYWVDEMASHGFDMVRCILGAKMLSLPMQALGEDLAAKKVNYKPSDSEMVSDEHRYADRPERQYCTDQEPACQAAD